MQRVILVGDPFYSSLAHFVRVVRVFELCKIIHGRSLETQLFSYAGPDVGSQFDKLIEEAVAAGIVDRVVPVPLTNGNFFDLNRATSLVTYLRENMDLLLAEIRHKGRHINDAAASAHKLVVLTAPGFFGGWYAPPFVAENVRNVLMLDTIYHPLCETLVGTAWSSAGLKGRLQSMLLHRVFYGPSLRVVNRMRTTLGLPTARDHAQLFSFLPIIDPNVPSYLTLSRPVDGYNQVGPLLFQSAADRSRTLRRELEAHKGAGRLVYLTLGGSVKSAAFVSFVADLVGRTMAASCPDADTDGSDLRFFITTGSVIDPDEVRARLDGFGDRCLVRPFADAQVVTSVADVAVGVMGQGHVLSAAKHGCPLVMCPINADQVTHAQLVQRLGLGVNPLRVRVTDTLKSHKLIAAVLASVDAIADAVIEVLGRRDRYRNAQVTGELGSYDDARQAEVVARSVMGA
jgi:UDP:flavonoid glycosyltransferase YjiC (YdhE family)